MVVSPRGSSISASRSLSLSMSRVFVSSGNFSDGSAIFAVEVLMMWKAVFTKAESGTRRCTVLYLLWRVSLRLAEVLLKAKGYHTKSDRLVAKLEGVLYAKVV